MAAVRGPERPWAGCGEAQTWDSGHQPTISRVLLGVKTAESPVTAQALGVGMGRGGPKDGPPLAQDSKREGTSISTLLSDKNHWRRDPVGMGWPDTCIQIPTLTLAS